MFYSTKIKSLGAGGAIDVNGRWLRFIGRLPVKEGDTVYTDGNVIFGNAPPKGAPMIVPDDPRGIPVLGKKDSKGNELRGYFTTKGKYKPYKIAGNAWITNGQKIYAHDNGEDNIIDAEIALDENGNESGFYTVEKKIIESEEEDDSSEILFFYTCLKAYSTVIRTEVYSMLPLYRLSYRPYIRNGEVYQYWWDDVLFREADYIRDTTPYVVGFESNSLGNGYEIRSYGGFIDKDGDGIIKDCSLIIKENEVEIATLKLSDLTKFAEDIAFKYINIEIPDEESKRYIKSRASLCNFKILSRDKWEAIIKIE